MHLQQNGTVIHSELNTSPFCPRCNAMLLLQLALVDLLLHTIHHKYVEVHRHAREPRHATSRLATTRIEPAVMVRAARSVQLVSMRLVIMCICERTNERTVGHSLHSDNIPHSYGIDF